jgi:hypothetical protein
LTEDENEKPVNRLAIDIYKTDDFAPWHAPDAGSELSGNQPTPTYPAAPGIRTGSGFMTRFPIIGLL